MYAKDQHLENDTFTLISLLFLPALSVCFSPPNPLAPKKATKTPQTRRHERPHFEVYLFSTLRFHWFSSWWLDVAEMMLVCSEEDRWPRCRSTSPELNKTKKWRGWGTIDEFPTRPHAAQRHKEWIGSTDRLYHNCWFFFFFFLSLSPILGRKVFWEISFAVYGFVAVYEC